MITWIKHNKSYNLVDTNKVLNYKLTAVLQESYKMCVARCLLWYMFSTKCHLYLAKHMNIVFVLYCLHFTYCLLWSRGLQIVNCDWSLGRGWFQIHFIAFQLKGTFHQSYITKCSPEYWGCFCVQSTHFFLLLFHVKPLPLANHRSFYCEAATENVLHSSQRLRSTAFVCYIALNTTRYWHFQHFMSAVLFE